MIRSSRILLIVFLVGCSSTRVTSDSQTGKHTIQCLNYVNRCHEKARKICQEGYLVTNRVRPRKIDDNTEFTLNIKCRQPTMY